MSLEKDLLGIVSELDILSEAEFSEIEKLIRVATDFEQYSSRSWIGYHSRVYYRDFQAPARGARFSQEWGFIDTFVESETIGDWVEYQYEEVVNEIEKRAGGPDMKNAKSKSRKLKDFFEEKRSYFLSLIHANSEVRNDSFIEKCTKNIESLKVATESDFINLKMPRGQIISRDTEALYKGVEAPPHVVIASLGLSLMAPIEACSSLKKKIQEVCMHLRNLEKKNRAQGGSHDMGQYIFIGHGRSHCWRELKDFIKDRLNLEWDEFNRSPVAGHSTVERLKEVIEQACFAFLIMTAEDEQQDGSFNARMNVIHEVGLFQGKLGFSKAIILLEDGCAEFSNIQGLNQIRFPKGNISAKFEEVRHVLEREKIIK